ncbi:hypothetical protein SAMN05421806_103467 [Streptomyces indicus]|uniref:Uncharacterized protein n=2 Tax=Streptomyces indicus TaxID=417292 RepID=A0A1G8XXT3_9ACTN|nr:hypothetical protein SAMN05421806_103467 [Streptomyces indicus]
MQPYDPSRHPIPGMRPSGETPPSHSATPIYDDLYAEWRRSFKALPGDRTGEEDLGFTAFGNMPQAPPRHPRHEPPPPTWQHMAHRPGGFPAALPPGPRRER